MRNLILFTVLLFSGFVSAQSFNFNCAPVCLEPGDEGYQEYAWSDVVGGQSSQLFTNPWYPGVSIKAFPKEDASGWLVTETNSPYNVDLSADGHILDWNNPTESSSFVYIVSAIETAAVLEGDVIPVSPNCEGEEVPVIDSTPYDTYGWVLTGDVWNWEVVTESDSAEDTSTISGPPTPSEGYQLPSSYEDGWQDGNVTQVVIPDSSVVPSSSKEYFSITDDNNKNQLRFFNAYWGCSEGGDGYLIYPTFEVQGDQGQVKAGGSTSNAAGDRGHSIDISSSWGNQFTVVLFDTDGIEALTQYINLNSESIPSCD